MHNIDKKKLAELVTKILKFKKVISFDQINEININSWDSLAKLKLILTIEEEYNISVDMNEAENFTSFNKIFSIINNKKNLKNNMN